MKEKLKAFAYAMSGFSGCMLAAMAAAIAALNYDLPAEWRELHGWFMGLAGGAVLTSWLVFPRMRVEIDDTLFTRWFWLVAFSVYGVAFTIPPAWHELNRLIGFVSFGTLRVPSVLETWCLANRGLGWTGVAVAVGAVVWAWRKFVGVDRAVLGSLAVANAGMLATFVFPEAMKAIGIVVAGFFISLTWGGPIGQGAQNLWRTILALFGRRPTAKGPTSILVPEKGAEISKL